MSLRFPQPFSKHRYLIINRIPELERALEATQFKSHFIDGGYQPRERKKPNFMQSPNRDPNVLLGA